MYRKPYVERLKRIQRLSKRELVERIIEMAGMSGAAADEAVNGYVLAVGTWLEAR